MLFFLIASLQITPLGSHFIQGCYYRVEIVDSFAFFCTGYGLEIYNITNPTNPQLVGQKHTIGDATGICVAGDFVYIADMYMGLTIFSVTNISNPIVYGQYNTNGFVEDVAVNQNLAYLADDIQGLIILDISDPTNPVYLGSYETDAVLYSVRVVDTIAYLGSNNKPLQIVNVADPASPYLICEFPLQDEVEWIEAAYIVDTIAFLAGTWYLGNLNNNFLIVNIADPSNPSFISGLDFEDIGTDVVVQGNYAYVNAEQAGVRIVDISNLSTPIEAGYFNEAIITGYTSAIKDSILIIPEHTQGFSVVNIKNPARLVKLAHKQSLSYQDFEIYGSHYLSLVCNLVSKTGSTLVDYYTTLEFIDLQDMLYPSILSELNFLGTPFNATALTFGYPYSALGISRSPDQCLAIFDCSNPNSPQLARFEKGPIDWSVKLCGPYIYVGSSSRLYIGDIYSQQFWIDSISIPERVHSMIIEDSLAYLSCRFCMAILNMNQLTILSTYFHDHYFAGLNNGITLQYPNLYISYWDTIYGGSNGFMIYDISNPTAPMMIIDTATPEPFPPSVSYGYARGCNLVDTLFFLCCGTHGFEIWNVQEPAQPIRLLAHDTPGLCKNIRVINDTILVMDGKSIEVYALTETGVAENYSTNFDNDGYPLTISPNPFFEKIEIKYLINHREKGAKSLKIYNAAGQFIKNILLPVTNSALPRTISWDGTDNAGLKLPYGIYFVELIVDNQTYIKKVVLLK